MCVIQSQEDGELSLLTCNYIWTSFNWGDSSVEGTFMIPPNLLKSTHPPKISAFHSRLSNSTALHLTRLIKRIRQRHSCVTEKRNVALCYNTSWEHQASGRLSLTSDRMHVAWGGSYGVASLYESHHPHVMSVCARCSPVATMSVSANHGHVWGGHLCLTWHSTLTLCAY